MMDGGFGSPKGGATGGGGPNPGPAGPIGSTGPRIGGPQGMGVMPPQPHGPPNSMNTGVMPGHPIPSPGGEFHDQADADWIVIRRSLWGHLHLSPHDIL
jgi:hypothetical protein